MLARLQDIENNWTSENDRDIKEFIYNIRKLDRNIRPTLLQRIKQKISKIIHRK